MTIQSPQPDARAALRPALWSIVFIGITEGLIAAVVSGAKSALGVAVGASIAALNLWAIAWVVRGLTARPRSDVPWGLLGVLKFVVLVFAVYGLIKTGWFTAGALLIGYGALPLGILAAQLKPRDTLKYS